MNSRLSADALTRSLFGVMLVVFVLFPIFWVGLSSFKTEAQVRDNGVLPCSADSAVCFEPTGENYRVVFDTFEFGSALTNSMAVGLLVVIVTVPFAAMGSYALARYNIPAKRAILVLVLATQFFPPVVLVLPYFSLFRTLDVEALVAAVDLFDLLGEDAVERVAAIVSLTIINTSRTIPFCMWLLFGFFDGLPRAIEEAARIDGCGEWAVFRRIIMPLALPGLLTSAIFAFLLSWNEYLYAFLIGDNAITAPVAMARTVGERDVVWEQISAAGIMVMVPMLVLAFSIRKYFISGITMGAVK